MAKAKKKTTKQAIRVPVHREEPYKVVGVITLVVFVFYLLTDLTVLNFSLNPWTILFLIIGLLLVYKQ